MPVTWTMIGVVVAIVGILVAPLYPWLIWMTRRLIHIDKKVDHLHDNGFGATDNPACSGEDCPFKVDQPGGRLDNIYEQL